MLPCQRLLEGGTALTGEDSARVRTSLAWRSQGLARRQLDSVFLGCLKGLAKCRGQVQDPSLAALDLSKAGFGDMSSASKMLGKALNDPVKGMTALSRAGVTFSQAQKDQVAALVASGDVLGAQKLILAEVESQVGGAAAAYGKTMPGQISLAIESLKNSGAITGRTPTG